MASSRPREVQVALNLLRGHMSRYGYLPVDVPIIQPAELFLTRAGDQILNKLFTFERSGVSFALRPEFTSPALRRYIEHHLHPHETVVRWQVAGIIFEDDPARADHSYERVSSGAECIGLAGPGAEAEIIAMAAQGCAILNRPIQTIILGSMQCVRDVLANYEIDPRSQRFILSNLTLLRDAERGPAAVLARYDAQSSSPSHDEYAVGTAETRRALELLVDASDRGQAMGGRTRADIARRLSQRQQRGSQRDQFRAALDMIARLAQIRDEPEKALDQMRTSGMGTYGMSVGENWLRVSQLLRSYGVKADAIIAMPVLTRDWEYYSGLTFELYTSDGRHVAGGGRYDSLSRLLGADHDIPAVGFTYYLSELLSDQRLTSLPDRLWTLKSSLEEPAAVVWTAALRERGLRVEVLPNVSSESDMLRLTTAGALEYQGQSYMLSDIDALMAKVNDAT